MDRKAIGLAVLAVLAACGAASSDEDRIEASIREGLKAQGNVEEVSLVRQGADRFTGEATVRDDQGQQRRMTCIAERTGETFNWRCAQAIDEAMLREVEGLIRERLSELGTVTEVALERAGDEDNMAGYAVYRDPAGGEIRTPCRAVRDAAGDNRFSWRCGEAAEAWAAEQMAQRAS